MVYWFVDRDTSGLSWRICELVLRRPPVRIVSNIKIRLLAPSGSHSASKINTKLFTKVNHKPLTQVQF